MIELTTIMPRNYSYRFNVNSKKIVSYSQNGEDVVLYRIFKGIKKGFYIDIGAADPVEDSVTKLFYELGWSGINVEPLLDDFTKLEKDRPRDINLRLGIGNKKDRLIFYEFKDIPGWSTFSKEIAKKHISKNLLYVKKTVPVLTLKALCQKYVKNKKIDFLKIDVEGFEKQVIEEGDWVKFRPKVIVIEGTKFHEWKDMMKKIGYLFAQDDGLNKFYVRQEDKKLLGALSIHANTLDNYEIYSYLNRISHLENDKNRLLQKVFKLEIENNNLNRILLEIKSAKTFRVWQKFAHFKKNLFNKNH